ncbi:alpha/beta hydrolase [Demequina flava]|uniref:alpha/beta hydrolase n=1 Tax=Demequina flava TaxID=1095025 RepID=UPI0007802588|nr:alpha/beta hydrolase [Demequina flava]
MSTLAWNDDILDGYESASLGAPRSATDGLGDGPLERTLVRSIAVPDKPRAVALVVHGYNDYFFGVELAGHLAKHGCAVYAVDMRRAGRSLREGNQPHHIGHIRELGEDIGDAAEAAVTDARERGLGDLPLLVHAHSTGALATTVWAHDNPADALAGLILDGPFYGLVLPGWQKAAMRIVPGIARVRERQVVVPAPSPYTTGLINRGWDFDTAWKRPDGVGATAGWVAATGQAQRRVSEGLEISVPILVATSDTSGPDRLENPHHGSQDTVVDVDAVRRYSAGLGENVQHLIVPGAIHDLTMSENEPRAAYLDAVGRFVDTVVG